MLTSKYIAEETRSTMIDNTELVTGPGNCDSILLGTSVVVDQDVESGTTFDHSKRSKSFVTRVATSKGSIITQSDDFTPRRIMSLPMAIRKECFDFKDDKPTK
jgi:hypothetical protein